jgi:thymidylate kinase
MSVNDIDADSLPRCIHLAGVDGTGKTTQARAILSWLQGQGIAVRYVWLRFPCIFSTPFRVYARLRGYSRRETVAGHQHGYWDFGSSWLMSRIFPWALLLDTLVVALVKIYVPLWRDYTVICDRFIVDILVDLLAGLDDNCFDERLPGRLFWALLPRSARVVVFDLDTQTAQRRCPELGGDRTHSKRRAIYLDIARRRRLPVVIASDSVDGVFFQLEDEIAVKADRSTAKLNPVSDAPLDRS